MNARDSAITDDVRAAVALRHLHESERARGNANAREEECLSHWRSTGSLVSTSAATWAAFWRAKSSEHYSEALAILPPCDSYDHPAPAYVGGA